MASLEKSQTLGIFGANDSARHTEAHLSHLARTCSTNEPDWTAQWMSSEQTVEIVRQRIVNTCFYVAIKAQGAAGPTLTIEIIAGSVTRIVIQYASIPMGECTLGLEVLTH